WRRHPPPRPTPFPYTTLFRSADTRQRKELIDIIGHFAAMLVDDCLCALMQAQGTARVAQLAPRAKNLGLASFREIGGSRPTFNPFLPLWRYPRHRCLLAHDLTDQNPPS